MNTDPFVSILIPIYNVENYIERCARSVFEQTYSNIEYIFVDDASPDHSVEILERVMKDYPERAEHVKIIRFPENRGLSIARNTLVDSCQTEWLMHVDSDDWVEKNIVESVVIKQQETAADLVIADYVFEKVGRQERYSYIESNEQTKHLEQLLHENVSHVIWGKLIRTSIVKDNSIYAIENHAVGEDWQVIIPIAYYSKVIAATNIVGYHYNKTRVEALTVKSSDVFSDYYNDITVTLNRITSFLSDKEPLYSSMFVRAYFDKMLYCMLLAVSFDNTEIFNDARSKAKLKIKQAEERFSMKDLLFFLFKSNFFFYKKFLQFVNGPFYCQIHSIICRIRS